MISFLVLLALPLFTSAKIGLDHCEPYTYNVGPIPIFYCPLTGEICEMLECAGPNSSPGCPDYNGPSTYIPQFVPTFTPPPVVIPSESATSASSLLQTEIATPTELMQSSSFQSVSDEAPYSSSFIESVPSYTPSYTPSQTNESPSFVTVVYTPAATAYMSNASSNEITSVGLAVFSVVVVGLFMF
jgi:hypothetical protein